MNILVTGGAGFIGSNIVEEIVKEHNVWILDNLHSGNLENLKNVKDKIHTIICPCADILKLDIPRMDMIFHLGIPSSSPMYKKDPFLVGEAINGTIGIFEYAKREKVDKVFFASSSSVYNGLKPPHREDMDIKITDYYTEARLAIERIAKLYSMLHGVKSVGFRFFSVYGHHEEAKGVYANIVSQFLWDLKQNKSPIIYGDGKQTRDLTYVKDVVDTFLLFMNKDIECDIFNIGTGIAYSFNDIVDILNSKLDKNIKPTHIKTPINNYVNDTLADISKIRKFGYNPKYSFDRGIDEILNGHE